MRGITQNELKEMLSYDPETGYFTWLAKRKGKAAGTQRGNCRRIRINSTLYFVHRLAWLYVYGRMPNGDVDHTNGDPTDNKIANLRECSRQENLWNIGVRRSNKSGFRGVHWNKKENKWCAQINAEGKKNKHLGYFATAELASVAYEAKAKETHGKFYRAPVSLVK